MPSSHAFSARLDSDLCDLLAVRHSRAREGTSGLNKRELGQFFTPLHIAEFMASLIDGESHRRSVSILDPGAGVGALFASAVEQLCSRPARPERITVVAVEMDCNVLPHLEDTMRDCARRCEVVGVDFRGEIQPVDYLEFAGRYVAPTLGAEELDIPRFDLVITNPPYQKIHSQSTTRGHLTSLGLDAPNLYAAFLAVSSMFLRDGGELIAITPRSFCNGVYFRPFRRAFLRSMRFTRLHEIESRAEAFADDSVLQENVIFRAVKGGSNSAVVVTAGSASLTDHRYGREIGYEELILPDDPDQFIHLPTTQARHDAGYRVQELPCSLADLGLEVSTGRVVDFRAREHLRAEPDADTAPLIYPGHFLTGQIAWPKESRKPNAIVVNAATTALLVPSGYYVLVRRFSTKEERRRVVTAVYDPDHYPEVSSVGFENHLNYIHKGGQGLECALAYGLAAFLGSTPVDRYFRQFSGHTQVNARDLRKLRYPTAAAIRAIGEKQINAPWEQATIDEIVDSSLRHATKAP